MTVVCAWCGCLLGQKDGLGVEGITSGMCGECFAAISLEIASAHVFESETEAA